jgi:hypothetical protein
MVVDSKMNSLTSVHKHKNRQQGNISSMQSCILIGLLLLLASVAVWWARPSAGPTNNSGKPSGSAAAANCSCPQLDGNPVLRAEVLDIVSNAPRLPSLPPQGACMNLHHLIMSASAAMLLAATCSAITLQYHAAHSCD